MLKFKKVIGLILAAVMVLTLLPSASKTTYAADIYFSGSGTDADPFIIKDNAGLTKLAELVNADNATYKKAYYKLSDSFDNSLQAYSGPPIGTWSGDTNMFQGHFNGNFKTVHLEISVNSGNNECDFVGLFGVISGSGTLSSIKNLRVVGSVSVAGTNSSAQISIGSIAGLAQNATFQNCATETTVSSTALGEVDIGGILGDSLGAVTIRNSYFVGSLKANSSAKNYTGGIAGYMQGSGMIDNCYAIADFPANEVCTKGGITGGFMAESQDTATIKFSAFATDTSNATTSATGNVSNVTLQNNLSDATKSSMKLEDFLNRMNSNKSTSDTEWNQKVAVNNGYPYHSMSGTVASSIIDMSDTNPPAAGIGWTYANNNYKILNGANVTVKGNNSGSKRHISIEKATASITLDNVEITVSECAFIMGTGAKVDLTLVGENILKSGSNRAGLSVESGMELTINGTGSLTATGGLNAAGIGGGNWNGGGIITINSGTITANGDTYAAGIGSGSRNNQEGGTITINGGTITADKGLGRGSIYNGEDDKVDTVIINGGTITADIKSNVIAILDGSIIGTVTPQGTNSIKIEKAGTKTSFEAETSDSLTVTPEEAVAKWSIVDGLSGISFAYKTNTGFIKVTGIRVKNPGDLDAYPETVILVPGVNDSGELMYNINLTTEKLEPVTETSLTFKSYSIDGGVKWKTGTPFDKNTTDGLIKILDKGSKLVLATEVQDKKSKQFPEDTVIITFAEIAKREKTSKRIPNYLIMNTDNILSADAVNMWTLAKTATDTEKSIDGISYSFVDSTGKKSDGSWYTFPEDGIKVEPLPDNGKTGKIIYFYHIAPQKVEDKYIPATKSTKLTVSTQIKAPVLKPDYKNEVFKGKAGLSIKVGTAASLGFTKTDKGNALLVNLTEAINNGETVTIFTMATAKTPASASQVVQIATRPDLSNATDAISVTGNKLKLGSGYEVNTSETGIWNDGSGKWGGYKAVPSKYAIMLVDDTGMIRKKNTVKLDKSGSVASGSPASESYCFVVTYENTAAENKPVTLKPTSVKIGRCVTIDDLEWIVFSDHVMLAGFSPDTEKLPSELVIPDTIESKPVTGIMSKAFYEDNMLTKVTIPASVTSIGFAAFAGSKVTEVIFSKESALDIISAAAFNECKITTISLPATVEQIGSTAFKGTSLTEITFNGPKPIFYGYDNKSGDGKDVFGDVSSNFKIKYIQGDASWADYTAYSTEAVE